MAIEKIKQNIWQFNFQEFGSCVYLIKIKNKNILIDTGSPMNKQELLNNLKELNFNPKEIDIIILTHNHFDHTGNIDLFPNAKIYGSKEDFKQENTRDKSKLNNKELEILKTAEQYEKKDFSIIDIDKLPIKEFKIIKTPGHTPGGICILYQDVLFSGDTIFGQGYIGRTDLSGGDYEELQKSIEKLKRIEYKILCPGHLI